MNKLYVRVAPKSGVTQFYRCAILFTLAWALVEVDAATTQRLHEEQMLEVSDTEPEGYVAPVVVDPVEATTTVTAPVLSAEERLAAIRDAITGLDADVATNWTKGGLPAVPAITAIVGFDVTAAERDQVWAEIQAAKAQ
jgi:hypothetical protein